jgi:hypothetical protein
MTDLLKVRSDGLPDWAYNKQLGWHDPREVLDVSRDIYAEIIEELDNPKFKTRIHGRSALYKAGCDGPMCTKAHRDKTKEEYDARVMRKAGREVKPRVTSRSQRVRRYDTEIANAIARHKDSPTWRPSGWSSTPSARPIVQKV